MSHPMTGRPRFAVKPGFFSVEMLHLPVRTRHFIVEMEQIIVDPPDFKMGERLCDVAKPLQIPEKQSFDPESTGQNRT
jgi:hypothetical protein